MSTHRHIPECVHHTLWSYDIDALDVRRDQRLIITQVLNRGGAEAVRWLRTQYTDPEIAAVVQTPARGRWFPQVLHFWAAILNLQIPANVIRQAVLAL